MPRQLDARNLPGCVVGGVTSFGGRVFAGGAHDVVSLVSALVIALGKIAISLLSAFALVYFRSSAPGVLMIFVTLMPPVEVRIFRPVVPTSACSTPTPA
jgi:hypothetical protein